MKQKLVRRSQTLSPFGVGAIIDIEGESLVAADITRWKNQGEDIREPRLEELLGVTKFKMGIAAPDNPWTSSKSSFGIPYFRFPQWLFCPRCRRMIPWSTTQETGISPECKSCARTPKPRLVPMRFVMACPYGHLADVPWGMWAHFKAGKCEKHMLEFRTKPGGSGLGFLSIRCRTCDAERTLAGIASPDSLMELKIRCPGRQPWQEIAESRSCNGVPQVLQRGATNLTFAITASSIDIPPFSDFSSFSSDNLLITNMPEFGILKSGRSNPFIDYLIDLMADKAGMTREKVQSIVNAELRAMDADTSFTADEYDTENDLLIEEFNAFLSPDIETDPRDRFIKRRVTLESYLSQDTNGPYKIALRKLADLFDALVQVTRLREVRVLRGFSRLAPAIGESENEEGPGTFSVYGTALKIVPKMVPADLGLLGPDNRWLPAIEVYGEGIFFSLSELALQEWENNPYVQNRIEILKNRHNRSKSSLAIPTPRLLFLHTLAHILIRQLSFECGYSLASLRERIYAAEPGTGTPMAGILIYTAAGDAEGTLGGLVREGEPDRILSTITMALQNAEWCSSDPLCRESRGQGMEAMNLAACHACALLPETSCIFSNRLLDRTLLLGSTDNIVPGFFSPLMDLLFTSSGDKRWRV